MITRFSSSSLRTYATCPELFNKKYNLGLDEGIAKSLPARYGEIMIHQPITEWYRNGGNYQPDFEKLWLEGVQPTDAEMMVKKNANYNIKQTREIFKEYVKRFEDDFKEYEVYNVEQYISRDMSILPYGSKCDVVLRRKTDGVLIPNEIKSSLYEFILTAKEINHQFLGELWTYDTLEGMVNFVHVVKDWTIQRYPIQVQPETIKRWMQDTKWKIETIDLNYRMNIWPMNAPEACARFNKECPFLDLCEQNNLAELIEAWPKREIYDPSKNK